jgi:hypothetical protein
MKESNKPYPNTGWARVPNAFEAEAAYKKSKEGIEKVRRMKDPNVLNLPTKAMKNAGRDYEVGTDGHARLKSAAKLVPKIMKKADPEASITNKLKRRRGENMKSIESF